MKNNFKKMIFFSLLVLALFVVACAPQLDPEGNPLPKEALAGQAVYVSVSNEMLKSGVKLDKGTNRLVLSPQVEAINSADFFASINSELKYASKFSKPREVYEPGKTSSSYKGWGWMSMVKPGVNYYVYMKNPATLIYPIGPAEAAPVPKADLSVCKNSQYDYNDDGFVGKKDANFLATEIVMSKKKCPEGKKCDFNQDDKVNAQDIGLFANINKDCIAAVETDPSLEKATAPQVSTCPVPDTICTEKFELMTSKSLGWFAFTRVYDSKCQTAGWAAFTAGNVSCGAKVDSCIAGKGCVAAKTEEVVAKFSCGEDKNTLSNGTKCAGWIAKSWKWDCNTDNATFATCLSK